MIAFALNDLTVVEFCGVRPLSIRLFVHMVLDSRMAQDIGCLLHYGDSPLNM